LSVNISVIVPVYEEEANIQPFIKRCEPVLKKISNSYEIIFILDPSPDNTEDIIQKEISINDNIRLIKMSRRFGQPAATMAGLFESKGDCCVVIDVDLQDPPELIEQLYKKFSEGFDVVYARRQSRKGETFIKRTISTIGYYIINKISDVDIPRNTGDFRILSRRVVEELKYLKESHGFLRGLVAFVGFKQHYVDYIRDERLEGSGKYNRFTGSLKIGFNGIIGFSSQPLFFMSVFGFFIAGLSFLLGFWYLCQKLIGVQITPGLSTTVLLITFFSGVQLLGLGLVGEYIGRIYDEVKGRPMYIIDKKVNFEKEK
jgi:polyisoprenyl-phosphate glycosyltransferase